MNCKPGDLAYVRDRGNGDRAAGMVVEVVRDAGFWTIHFGFQCWLCRAKTPIPCRRGFTGRDSSAHEVVFADSDLMPISGLPVHDEQHDEVTA
ncbi:hypothetical protein C9I56_39020 [Paraburkholderia caribensis]|uniref:hypothetical protein n=1 Tax=Paraburkholderia caribensis TaxID=75105 RepID=UPI000D17D12F|nr:hypothetical protein [Paraburkholderia caribensis]PTB23482.1 hypothetical protein C9I56_39020 [Paraburkholderia caribensis]